MKYNQVMVDNLFMDKFTGDIFPVLSISKERITFDYETKKEWQAVPVPITEERLLECGFEKRCGKYGYYFVNTKLSGFRIWAHEDHDQHKWVIGKKNFETGDTFPIREIVEHIHQIQKIYLDLTDHILDVKALLNNQ